MVYLPPEIDLDSFKKETQRTTKIIRGAGEALVSAFKGLDAKSVSDGLHHIWREYEWRLIESDHRAIGTASNARESLQKVAEIAEKLASAIGDLEHGAYIVMNRQNVPEDLFINAEPFNLPDRDPHGPGMLSHASDDEHRDHLDEWLKGGRWMIRLKALAELSRLKADRIYKQAGKGGRKPFSDRLLGSPEDWLAERCQTFAKENGCGDLKVINSMVLAIRDAEHGQSKGRPPKEKRRKAVRKLAQTKPKTGTV